MQIPEWFYAWAFDTIDSSNGRDTPYVLAWKAYQKGKRERIKKIKIKEKK